MKNIIFIHGLESSGSGFKGRFFKKIFPEILTPDFTGNLDNRMKRLRVILSNYKKINIIGSSFGGLMATLYTIENPSIVSSLILLAPALPFQNNLLVNKKNIDIKTVIYHGIHDTVVPLEPTEKIAEKIFTNLFFYKVNDDHMLHKTLKNIEWNEFYGKF